MTAPSEEEMTDLSAVMKRLTDRGCRVRVQLALGDGHTMAVEAEPIPRQPAQQTRCRRCFEWNDGDPWYCPRCGKETTLTPHDGGVLGDTATWTRTKPAEEGDT